MPGPRPKTIVILGAGPAGSATAIALQRALRVAGTGAHVVLIHAPGGQDAAIGETVPPAATPALRQLGLDALLDEDRHLPCPGSVSVWGSERPGHNDFLLDPSGTGFHLDRARFDADLRAAATASGVDIRRGWRFRKPEPLGSGFRLWLSPPNSAPTALDADFVVDATGQAAAFARRLGVARNLYDEVISVCAFVHLPSTQDRPAPTWVQTQPHGWWYGARLPGDRAIVCLCTDRETLHAERLSDPARWARSLRDARWFAAEYRRQLGVDPAAPGRLYLRPAPSAILSNVIGPGWLAVGDAASSYDSMTSAGITKALLHGRLAGEGLAQWIASGRDEPLRRYQQQVFADFSQYLRLHQQLYRSETRYAQTPFWSKRGLV